MPLSPTTPDASRYAEFLELLYQKRKILSLVYLLVLAIAAPIFLIGPDNIVGRLRGVSPDYPDDGSLWLLIFFPLTLVLFLWGGGHITHKSKTLAHVLLPFLASAIVATYSNLVLWRLLMSWDNELVDHWFSPEAFLLFSLLLSLAVGTLKMRRAGHFRMLVCLNRITLICVGALATLAVALAMVLVQAWSLSNLQPLVLAYPAYAVLWVLGTSLVLLWHRETPAKISATPSTEIVPGSLAPITSGPYIVSIARVSSLLLIVLYFGISQGLSFGSHLNEIGNARRAFALATMRNHVLPLLARDDIERMAVTTDTIERQKLSDAISTSVENAHLPTTLGIVEVKLKLGAGFGRSHLLVSVKENQLEHPWRVETWFDSKGLIKSLNESDPTYLVADPPAEDIAIVAMRHGLKLERDESFESLYLRVENQLLKSEVAFPSSGFSFPIGQAVWLSNIVVCLMLALLYDRLGQLLRDPSAGGSAPWLVLDARERMTKGMAIFWIVAVVGGPWVLALITARMVFFNISVYQSSTVAVLFQLALAIVLPSISVPLSLSVISRVLHLKRQRV